MSELLCSSAILSSTPLTTAHLDESYPFYPKGKSYLIYYLGYLNISG